MKYMKIFTLFLFIIGSIAGIYSQDSNWRIYVEHMAEEEGISETTIENIYEELLYLENNQMNLNSITRDQLEQFPLLSIEEINAIMGFLEKNRPLYTVYELRNVPRLDLKTVELILPFFYTGETDKTTAKLSLPGIAKKGLNELQFRLDKTVTPRAGYGEFPDSVLERYPNRKYCGEDFYTSLRYSFRYRDKVQLGMTAEKDAGEPFFKSDHPKGYDHYGIHMIINDMGRLRTIALGDYRLSFGQGLILNNDFMVSKAWSNDNIARRTQHPKRHFSTAESGFFRGMAAVYEYDKISVTAFYSNRRIDANLSGDGKITSFKTDGLHRTPLEIDKKKNTREQVVGGNINFRKEGIRVGISGLYNTYDRVYNPQEQNYNIYYQRGSSHANASVDYSCQLPGFIFAGETAIAKNGAIATLNTAQYRPSQTLSFTLLHRYFPISYNSPYGQAFSEGSRVQNEKGLFFGSVFSPFRKFSVDTYIDFIRIPWLNFGIDTPSKAVEYYFLGNYAISRQNSLDIRYRYKQKEKNRRIPGEPVALVLPYATHKLRLRYVHELKNGWNFRTTADMAHYTEKHSPAENGFMISQNTGYRGKGRITGDIYLAYFSADTYNARLYSYERNLLNTFYMPSFYGRGYRLAISAKYNIATNLSFSVKAGYTHYFNRDTIGSGTEKINGNSRTDLFSYLRWKF